MLSNRGASQHENRCVCPSVCTFIKLLAGKTSEQIFVKFDTEESDEQFRYNQIGQTRFMCQELGIYLQSVALVKGSVPFADPVVAQRVGRGIALLFHDHGIRMG